MIVMVVTARRWIGGNTFIDNANADFYISAGVIRKSGRYLAAVITVDDVITGNNVMHDIAAGLHCLRGRC